MTRLRQLLIERLEEDNTRCDSGIERLAEDIEQIMSDYLADDWSIDDCK